MSIDYIMHVGICVQDLDRATRFYCEGLGFKKMGVLEVSGAATAKLLGLSEVELEAVYLERDGHRIELLHYPTPGTTGSTAPRPMNQLGLTHLAIRVRDLDRVIEQLVRLGGVVIEESRVYNADYDAHIVYLTDPDGTRLELADTPMDPTRVSTP